MGYMRHNAVIVIASDYVFNPRFGIDPPDVEGFRASLPEEWRGLIVGPVPSIRNGYLTYLFAPDGSKEGWDTSDDGDGYRQRFMDLFTFRYPDGSSPYDVLVVDARFGGDGDGGGEDELIVSTRHSTWRKP